MAYTKKIMWGIVNLFLFIWSFVWIFYFDFDMVGAAEGYTHGGENCCGQFDMQQKDRHNGETVWSVRIFEAQDHHC